MTNLVVVQGDSGAGKTTIRKYFGTELGFGQYAIDNEINNLREAVGWDKIEFRPIIRQIVDSDFQYNFWRRFWSENDCTYSPETARQVIEDHIDKMIAGELLSDEDRFHISYVCWKELMVKRDSDLLQGKDVVIEPFTSPPSRENAIKIEAALLPVVRRYMIFLRADREVQITRRMEEKGYTRETALQRMGLALDLTPPNVQDLVVLKYVNNTPEDLERIKADLRTRFGNPAPL
ncbi:MAG: hypothetical protein HY512_01630 [Candidatus Aenigmarchaeota archaeon]|nr:hypothetical protein [Candidatus Aenigmarchaeota archaeon]